MQVLNAITVLLTGTKYFLESSSEACAIGETEFAAIGVSSTSCTGF